jgi:hypothetical protein
MNIDQMTGPQLVATYNESAEKLGEKPVKRFADRKSALRRTQEIHARAFQLEPTKSRRYKGFNFPKSDTIKTMREGTLRASIRDAVAEGATFEQIQQVVSDYDVSKGKNPYDVKIRAYEGLRLLHLYVGYGLEERGGKIHLVK